MRELVVISGKGGTGKTSLVASFADLAERPVLADCDVDAADLHLVLTPTPRERHDFYGGCLAIVRPELCDGCGICRDLCRFGAIGDGGGPEAAPAPVIDPAACEGCGVCVRFCPRQAIGFSPRFCGEWLVGDTRRGPLVHARLAPAAENSGKLVATVRREARRLAEAGRHPWLIVDGPPGIGCPVIASLTGASLVLVVTEPTVAGEHDLERVLALARHFAMPAAVCVNKWDLAPAMAERIENRARSLGARLAGRIRFDPAVTYAQLRERSAVEIQAACAGEIRGIWQRIVAWLEPDDAEADPGRTTPGRRSTANREH